jgi:hypothetical protein
VCERKIAVATPAIPNQKQAGSCDCNEWSLPSVNQRFPSGPAVMLAGTLPAVGTGYSVMSPTAARAFPLEKISPAAKIANAAAARAGDRHVPRQLVIALGDTTPVLLPSFIRNLPN